MYVWSWVPRWWWFLAVGEVCVLPGLARGPEGGSAFGSYTDALETERAGSNILARVMSREEKLLLAMFPKQERTREMDGI